MSDMTDGAAFRSPIFSNNGMIRNACVGTVVVAAADACNSEQARRHSQRTVNMSDGQRVMLMI